MIKQIEQRGWKLTRRSDSVVKVKFARDLANWIVQQEELLARHQVTERARLINRIESFKTTESDEALQKKLTRAIQQFVTQEQWAGIRQNFYRYKRQHRDGIKVLAVSETVYSELITMKKTYNMNSLNDVISAVLQKSADLSDGLKS